MKLRRQSGVTLVELLIALVLGVFIVLAATQMFAYTKASTRSQEAAARLMENGRAATEILNRQIRMARYYGCAGVEAASVTNHYDSTKPAPAVAVSDAAMNGYHQQGLYGTDGASGAPDSITVFQAIDDDAAVLTEAVTLDAANAIKLAAGHGFTTDSTLAITDCTQADVINVSGISGGDPQDLAMANCATCTKSYNANAVVVPVKRSRFYLDTGASGERALWVEDPWDSTSKSELIEGVQDMQIAYGRDTDADGVADQYVSVANIYDECATSGDQNPSCWRKITSVRISLLLRSVEDFVTLQPQTYTYYGAEDPTDVSPGTDAITAADRRFYREFFTVIALRNYRP
ncbi:MAG: PilW family protein [Pseudomonadota bacterium]